MNYYYFYNYTGEKSDDGLPPDPKKHKEDYCTEFVTHLRQVYSKAKPPTWDPLPQCSHVKLAMIKEKGKRYACDIETTAESRVGGDVEQVLTEKVPVDSDSIFDAGTFDTEHQVILVEGVGGMGKTSLAYQYAKKWAEGSFSVFDAVVLVCLRDLNEHDVCEVDRILPHLLFLASDKQMPSEMIRHFFSELKTLFILDGWDETPASIHNQILKSLKSVSPLTTILITSRPDFSLNLHNLANRVEILGFTRNDIRDYFKAALESQLFSDSEVTSACDKLSSHFLHLPEIESCCYVPLNAAILAYIYLYRNQTLPVTRCELFQELILCCIVRELKTRQSDSGLKDVSSFEDLPADLKEQLRKLSELAFEGMMQNKIVFSQKELTSLSTLGLLHRVEGFGSIGKKPVTCNFIQLAVQELLAAYFISQLEPAEHSKQFINLLKINRMFPVLQFYSGLTRLANEGVRNLVINEFQSCEEMFGRQWHGNRSLLVMINCIFEAQMVDQAFYEQITNTHKLKMDFNSISLTPMDCLSLQYFLSSVGRMKKGNISIHLNSCSLNDDSISLLLGISPEQTLSKSVVLQSLESFSVMGNIYTDTGLIHFAKALDLTSICTIKTLKIGNGIVTNKRLEPLLESLSRQHSLEELELLWSSPHDDKSLEKIGEYAKKMSKLKKLAVFPNPSCTRKQFSSKETKQWSQSLIDGGNSLMYSLESSMVEELVMHIVFYTKGMYAYYNQVISSLNKTKDKINIKRGKTGLPHFKFDPQVLTPFGV